MCVCVCPLQGCDATRSARMGATASTKGQTASDLRVPCILGTDFAWATVISSGGARSLPLPTHSARSPSMLGRGTARALRDECHGVGMR